MRLASTRKGKRASSCGARATERNNTASSGAVNPLPRVVVPPASTTAAAPHPRRPAAQRRRSRLSSSPPRPRRSSRSEPRRLRSSLLSGDPRRPRSSRGSSRPLRSARASCGSARARGSSRSPALPPPRSSCPPRLPRRPPRLARSSSESESDSEEDESSEELVSESAWEQGRVGGGTAGRVETLKSGGQHGLPVRCKKRWGRCAVPAPAAVGWRPAQPARHVAGIAPQQIAPATHLPSCTWSRRKTLLLLLLLAPSCTTLLYNFHIPNP